MQNSLTNFSTNLENKRGCRRHWHSIKEALAFIGLIIASIIFAIVSNCLFKTVSMIIGAAAGGIIGIYLLRENMGVMGVLLGVVAGTMVWIILGIFVEEFLGAVGDFGELLGEIFESPIAVIPLLLGLGGGCCLAYFDINRYITWFGLLMLVIIYVAISILLNARKEK